MSAIKHSSAKHTYIFRYNGTWQQLVYDPTDAQKLGTLFARIVKMNQTRLAKQQAAERAAPVEQAFTVQPSATITGTESFAEALSKAIRESDAKIEAANIPAEAQAETPAKAQAETPAKSQAETPAKSQAETPAKEKEVKTEETKIATGKTEEIIPAKVLTPEQAEKKSKLKKALIIFSVIIGLFVLLGVGYFFVFGPADDPTINTDTNKEQQYNDIDELIEDLDE